MGGDPRPRLPGPRGVIAVDTNLLVYAHREDSPHHGRALACVTRLAEGTGRWAIPWPCIHEFLAVVTHPRIYVPPSPLAVALAQADTWCASPTVVLLAEAEGYWEVLRALVDRARVSGPGIHDARVAALCLVHGVSEFWSADRDFGRFRDLLVRNPLVG